jgi:hypothetical protein
MDIEVIRDYYTADEIERIISSVENSLVRETIEKRSKEIEAMTDDELLSLTQNKCHD